jgi:hypothetical protein
MTGRPTAETPGNVGRWGFCADCELWRYAADWFDTGQPACPVCGASPAALESIEGGVARVQLLLELPPGTSLPLLT